MHDAYAQALWQTVKAGTDSKKAVAAIKDALERHGRLALLPKIARAFERIASRHSATDQIVLSIARAEDESAARRAAKEFLKELAVTQKDVRIDVDETLIGGWRLEGGERLVDVSWKRHLMEMYQKIIV